MGVSEYHKPNTWHSQDSGSEIGGETIELQCASHGAQSRLFRFRLPAMTLEIIKAKHGNISAYLRELIAQDLGTNACPPLADRRRTDGETDLKTYTELFKPITKKRSKQKHANSSGNNYKVGRIRSAKKKTNQG